jgi:hypothetical protein
MSGITTGARQFNFMGANAIVDWNHNTELMILSPSNGWQWQKVTGNNYIIHNTTKLDLRALLDGSAKGLDFLNVSVQESLPWTCAKNAEKTPYVLDVITTVRPSNEHILTWLVQPPGFRAGDNEAMQNTLNPSQVVWGLWRYFVANQSTPNEMLMLEVGASSSFGQGEVAVAPNLYHTRIFQFVGKDGESMTQFIPAYTLVCAAQVVGLNEGQEFTQMIRSSQR